MSQTTVRSKSFVIRVALGTLTSATAILSVYFNAPPSRWVAFDSSPIKYVALGLFAFVLYCLLFIPIWLPAIVPISRRRLFRATGYFCVAVLIAATIATLIVVAYGNPHALIYSILSVSILAACIQIYLLRIVPK